jgi:hypothetical protein
MSVPPNLSNDNAAIASATTSRAEERGALWYPDTLREAEHDALRAAPARARTGLAFSGGGVRSATFCLGVIQGLSKVSRARKNQKNVVDDPLLSRFGFLSTVSGGGYFGGFLTQLFQRKPITRAADVEAVLADEVVSAPVDASASETLTPAYARHVMHWLRENGRYLAPTGAGDYLLALATVVRNWLSVQMVYATLGMLVLLIMQLLRWGLYFLLPANEASEVWRPHLQWSQSDGLLTFSPYYFLLVAMVAFAFTPIAATYWTIPNLRPASAPWKRIILIGPGPALLTAMIIYLVFRHGDSGMAPANQSLWDAASLFRSGVLSLWVAILGLYVTGAIDVLSRWWKTAAWALIGLLTVISTMLTRDHPIGRLAFNAFAALERTIDQDFVELFLVSWAVFSFSAVLIVLNEQARINQSKCNDQSAWPRMPRHHLTKSLSFALLPIAATLLLYMIDALGAYFYSHIEGGESIGTIHAALGGSIGAAALAPRMFEWYQRLITGSGKAHALPINAVLAVFAFILFMTWAVALATLAHGLVWEFDRPGLAPQSLLAPACAVAFLLLLASTQVFFRGFVNSSSLGSIYTQRIARAYLGASNLDRYRENIGVTEVQRDDDQVTGTDLRAAVVNKGAPIHLVNVCLNETLHAEMGVQQLDRKGLQLSVGPFGYCVGARHVLTTDSALPWRDADGAYRITEAKSSTAGDEFARRLRDRLFSPEKAIESGPSRGFRPFSNDAAWERRDLFGLRSVPDDSHPQATLWHHIADRFGPLKNAQQRPALDRTEVLPFSSWIGISGAAFSTGAGFRTSLPMALLCGFFNVRLGYWWDAGVQGNGGSAEVKSPQAHWLFRLFPVYGLLKTEMMAAYTGTNARRWYLSDGGHFENLALYELIRRRLKLIVSIDAGNDPDSAFEDLGNLVRKARIDFDTQIEFLDSEQVREHIDADRLGLGTLDDLRRLNRRESSDGMLGNSKTSLCHAALARIDYGSDVAEDDRYGWLLYIKPCVLTENLPADLAQYQIANPDFPHQTTADQFFNEAQWESYRKLGELTACRLFATDEGDVGLLDRLAKTSARPT